MDGYSIRWVDACKPNSSELYVSLPQLTLSEGGRLRLVPNRASAPPVVDELVSAGGLVATPPITGAIYQIVDHAGVIIHEFAAMPSAQSIPPLGGLTAFPNDDGTRAFLVPATTESSIGRGHWIVSLELKGAPDMDRWSVGGNSITEKAKLTFDIL